MALQKQLVPINLTQGLDEKTRGELVLPGKLTQAQNIQFAAGGVISTRDGWSRLSTFSSFVSGLISGVASLAQEVLFRYGNALYAHGLTGAIQPQGRGALHPVTHKRYRIMRNPATNVQGPDAAATSTGNVRVYVWEDNAGAYAHVRDDKQVYLAKFTLEASGTSPRAFRLPNGDVGVLYATAGNLQFRTLAASAPTDFSAATTLAADVAGTGPYLDADCRFWQSNVPTVWVCAYRSTTANTIKVFSANSAGTIQSGPVSVATVAAPTSISIAQGGTDARCCVLYNRDTAATVRFSIWTAGLGAETSGTLAAVTDEPDHTTAIWDSTAALYKTFYDRSDAGTNGHLHNCVYRRTLTTAGSVGSEVNVIGHCGLASRPFFDGSDVYVIAAHGLPASSTSGDTCTQPTHFLVKYNAGVASYGEVAGRFLAGTAGGHPRKTRVSNVFLTSTGYGIALTEKGRVDLTSGADNTVNGITLVDFRYDKPVTPAQTDHGTFYPGSAPALYDGVGVAEAGFHLYPERVALVDAAAGSMSAGTYQVKLVFEWTDANGRIWRSAPSAAASIVLGATRQIRVDYWPLKITRKTSEAAVTVPRNDIIVHAYQTEANGTLFYRATSASAAHANSATGVPATASITLNLADSALISGELLYTAGGAPDNLPPPACDAMAVVGDRLFCNSEDPSAFWYSKNTNPLDGLGFSDSFVQWVPADGGDITGFAPLNDKTIVFKKHRAYAIAGDGPNDLGQQNTYTEPWLIAPETGCVNPCSIVQTKDGVMFQSDLGFHLLDRSLGIIYVGAGVETDTPTSATAVVSACMREKTQQVVFTVYTTSTATLYQLIYDRYRKGEDGLGQWTTAITNNWESTPYGIAGAVEVDGALYAISNQGSLLKQLSTQTRDVGSNGPIDYTFVTAWVKPSALQGFQRAYALWLLGTNAGTGLNPQAGRITLTVYVGFDYASSYAENHAVNLLSSTYTSDPAGVFQARVDFTKQKCAAVRFKIVFTGSDEANVAGLVLSNLQLEVGLKRGGLKLPAVRQW